jgi:uncharacterized membrane protein HdeD (DUF308 family)
MSRSAGARDLRSLAFGLLTIALGAAAVATPWLAGEWSIALLGLLVFSWGVLDLIHAMRGGGDDVTDRYVGAVVAMIAGLLLFALPSLVLTAVVKLLAVLLAVDGVRAWCRPIATAAPGARGRHSTVS